jgi:hypothetical protein
VTEPFKGTRADFIAHWEQGLICGRCFGVKGLHLPVVCREADGREYIARLCGSQQFEDARPLQERAEQAVAKAQAEGATITVTRAQMEHARDHPGEAWRAATRGCPECGAVGDEAHAIDCPVNG